jgi:hypothetical protein
LSRAGLLVCLFSLSACLLGCDSDDPIIGQVDPNAPYRPELVAPDLNAQNQPPEVLLKWTCSDPDEDPLVYDLYFGKWAVGTSIIASGLTDTSYTIRDLDSATTYYWRVLARDPDGHATIAGVWQFSTWKGFRYPLMGGQKWLYDRTIAYVECDLNYPNVDPPGPTSCASIVTTLEGEFSWNDWPTYKLVESTACGGYARKDVSSSHYAQADDALYRINPSPFGLILPPPSDCAFTIEFMDRRFCSPFQLSTWLRSGFAGFRREATALDVGLVERALIYPLEIDAEWIARDSSAYGLKVTKRVTGRENVTVPSGTYYCYQIEWYIDFGEVNADVSVVDHICEVGLVRRQIIAYNVHVSSYQYANLGICDLVDTWELTEYTME